MRCDESLAKVVKILMESFDDFFHTSILTSMADYALIVDHTLSHS